MKTESFDNHPGCNSILWLGTLLAGMVTVVGQAFWQDYRNRKKAHRGQ